MGHFEDLGLSDRMLSAVQDFGYDSPTPVQEQAIPLVLQGRDIIAAAKTGTGKTAAFSLPTMDTLPYAQRNQGPLMLIVTPTRELAQQIGEACQSIARHTHHRILTVVGGLSYDPQITALRKGIDVLIATPGRLIDLLDREAVRLGNVKTLVLDEADRMLDMGFWPSVKKIIYLTPKNRQTLLFSATIDKTIMDTAGSLLTNPAMVEIAHKGETADLVEQYVIHVAQAVKPALLKGVLAEHGTKRVIVFCRTRSRADATCRRLKRAGISAEAIHSDRTQNQRRRALDNFDQGSTHVIVATDVLARGIDVENVNYVVNYDLPMQAEDYIHRIGRTGRAGARGMAISFVSPETNDLLKDIQKLLKRQLPEMELEFFDMEAATDEAMAKAVRAESRRDPEIQAAKKELAAKKRKKAKQQAKAAEERQAASEKLAKKKRAAKKTKQTVKSAEERLRPIKTKSTSKSKKAKEPSVAPKRIAASGREANQDFRPGRSQRATLAKKRKHMK